MTQGGRPDENLGDVWERLEQEFQQRPAPPAPGPQVRGPAPPPMAPRRVSFSLARTRPRAVYALLAANVIMYGITWFVAQRAGAALIAGQQVDPFTYALLILGAKFNPLIDSGEWWRLLTPMVLHGSLLHLLFNTYALYVLGPQVESTFGTLRFLAVYLLGGLAGSVASYVWNANALSVGASGAIFGLFGALGAFAYTSRSLIGWEATRMQLYQMATLVAINLVFGFLPGSNIDNSAHVGGLVAGGLAGMALAPRYGVDRFSMPPSLVRRDTPLSAWGAAFGILVLIVAGFVVAMLVG